MNLGQLDIDSFTDSALHKASKVLHQMDWPMGTCSKGQLYPRQGQFQKKDLSACKKAFQEKLTFFPRKRLIDVCLCHYLSNIEQL